VISELTDCLIEETQFKSLNSPLTMSSAFDNIMSEYEILVAAEGLVFWSCIA
jgi:hypothetical protein